MFNASKSGIIIGTNETYSLRVTLVDYSKFAAAIISI